MTAYLPCCLCGGLTNDQGVARPADHKNLSDGQRRPAHVFCEATFQALLAAGRVGRDGALKDLP